VNSIVAPFGDPIEARPPVPTEEERIAEREGKKAMKVERRSAKRRSESAPRHGEEGVQEVGEGTTKGV
jgi:small subunit ribosomal protein S17